MHPLMQRVFESQADWQFVCESLKKNTSATWIFIWWKMKVLSGSRITKEVVGSYDKKGRRTHILKEKAIEHDDHYELKEHIMFDSPSAASSFCLWNSSNGRLDWKNRLWKTMDELLRNNE